MFILGRCGRPGLSGYEIMRDRCPESLRNGVQVCSLLRSGMPRKIKVRAGTGWTARHWKSTKAEKIKWE